MESSGSRLHCKRKRAGARTETVPVRGAAGGAAGGAARGAAGTVPEQRAQGALRPARAQRADTADAKRKQGEEPESERRSTLRNTNKAGTGPTHGV